MKSWIKSDFYGAQVFQQIDVEEAIDSSNGTTTLRMFGVTEVCRQMAQLWSLIPLHQNGNSVLAHITDFLPYFYIPSPRGLIPDELGAFLDHVNVSRCRIEFPRSLYASSRIKRAALQSRGWTLSKNAVFGAIWETNGSAF